MREPGEEQIRAIIAGTRRVLLRATADQHFHDSDGRAIDLSARFQGCCGLAQCVAGYALQDVGLTVKPVATQSLSGYWHGHAALTVNICQPQGDRWFVVDPTFSQFTAKDANPTPADHLDKSPEGAALLQELLNDGYAALTPARAALYLAAFCEGKEQLDKRSAFAFLINPPAHPYHFRRNVDSDEFSRENLSQRGWSIT